MTTPNILLIDIETSPLTGYTWGTYDQNLLKVLEFSKIMSVAYKWLNEKPVHVLALPDYTGYKKGSIDDRRLVKDIWDLLDKADIVIAHHGKKFDLPKLNAAFVRHGLNAPSAYSVVDTKQVASKYFRFDSNSLNNLGAYLNEGSKIENGGFDLWVRCIQGDDAAWALMKKYNKQDVVLLEKVYLRLRPFIENHPNLNLVKGSLDSCPSCQSDSLVKRGFSYTRTSRRQRYQCSSCKSWASGPTERVKVVST